MTLRNLFTIMDSDSNHELTKVEFHVSMEKGGIGLSGDEAFALFDHLDKNRDGKIGYAELVEQFSALNTQEQLKMVKETVQKWKDGRNGPENFFKDFCREDRTKSAMTKTEFL